ncbi:AAA family ATPase [Polynucleobacter sp. UB-Raua-W9]|jgi:RecA-family ATPase|uniref:AAA family ATPase n=1 Tax=Polynucleobacter sp. UB-Raua-W9 TaxID=1819736 RepID=UPI001BFD9DE5|nr:AAA family ATPase [Polynucleobacter sp. UB-Raua-W9]QWD71589.1 AAA family ATPase [Polynucleobacter sp. UB-Raua-W9]
MSNSKTDVGAVRLKKPSYDSIPESMRPLKAFVPYKLVPPVDGKSKWRKQAINPRTYKATDWNNPNDFVTFDQAEELLSSQSNLHGIGICFKGSPMIGGRYLIGVDLDGVYESGSCIKSHHLTLLNGLCGFVETSVSGTGKHIFTLSDEPIEDFKCHDFGVEVFSTNAFIALTGDVDNQFSKPLDGSSLDFGLFDRYQRLWQQHYDAFAADSERDPNMSPEELRELVMSVKPPDAGRANWIKVGMICHHQERGSLDGLDIWYDWSSQGHEYPEIFGDPASYSELEYQWHSFKKDPIRGRSLATHKTLRFWANKNGPCDRAVFEDAEYDLEETSATEYVVDGFIAEGIFVLSGQSGIGKTTLLLPLAALAAHICADDHPLKPILCRPVLYLTEDKKQAVRILSGLRKHYGVKIDTTEMNQRFKIRETHRMSKDDIAQLIINFASDNKMYMKDVNGNDVLIPVLIVADTVAASLDLDDENNNSEVSKFISKIKSACSDTGASLWLIAHISKAMNRANVSELSARGASAFGADANGTGFVVTDDKADEGRRFLILDKKRYEVDFNEVSFTTQRYEINVKNRLGQALKESYRIGSIEKSSEQNRKVASQNAQLTRDENNVLNALHKSGHIYIPKTLIGTLTGMSTGNAYQKLGGILAKLVADQRLEIMSTKDARADGATISANTKEVYRLKPAADFDVFE